MGSTVSSDGYTLVSYGLSHHTQSMYIFSSDADAQYIRDALTGSSSQLIGVVLHCLGDLYF